MRSISIRTPSIRSFIPATIRKGLLLALTVIALSHASFSQIIISVSGPGGTCESIGTAYTYSCSTSYTSGQSVQWCITGSGTISGTSSSCLSGTSLSSITVTWTAAGSGTVGVHVYSADAPSGTLNIGIYAALVPGTISNSSQTIKYGAVATALSASVPTGGGCSPISYSYQWQQGPDGTNWTNVSGGTAQNLSFSSGPTQTTYYRRMVTSNSSVTGYTNTALVTVIPPLAAGAVSPSAGTINYNTSPGALTVAGTTGGQCGNYSYQWQQSATNGTYTDISGATATSYNPGNLTANNYFRVKISCGTDTVYSNAAAITVYPALQAGAATPAAQSVSYNYSPGLLTLSGVSGGTGSYAYQWQQSADGTNYSNVGVGGNMNTYTPGSLTVKTWYRVAVTSNGVSVNSIPSIITVAPVLTGGSISGPSTPLSFGGSAALNSTQAPTGGNCGGGYLYQWKSSLDGTSYQPISGATGVTYTPNNITFQTYFIRQVNCGPETVSSNAVSVSVNPQLFSGTIDPSAFTISTGTSPGTLTGNPASGGACAGSYSYQWQSGTDGATWSNISGATAQNYTAGALSTTTYFRRRVTCGTDMAYTNNSTVTVATLAAGIDLNYIRIRDLTKPGITDTVTADQLTNLADVKQTMQYFDGLGRPVQTVMKQSSPLGKDRVSMQVYDPFSREVTKYLPYTSASSDGNYKINALQEQNSFNTAQFPNEQFYYGQTDYEASPLDRPLTTYAPGSNWVGANRGVSVQYLANMISDSVQIWNISLTPGSLPTNAGIYPAGQLYKTVTMDEQSHQVVDYKDKEGHVLLKKVQLAGSPGTAHVGWLCTYYVYDDLDNLRFVLQPRAVELINNTTNPWTILHPIDSELCFRYEYDSRKRMIIKKIPGAGEEWMVYDGRDRLIMDQDSVLRSTNIWKVIKYDNLNRPDSMGLLTDANNRAYHQNLAYNSTNYPVTSGSNFEYLTRTFYDDYSWMPPLTSLPRGLVTRYTSNPTYFITTYNTAPAYAVPVVQNTSTRGMLTGTITKVKGSGFYIFAVPYYDDHNRVIQTFANNFGNGIDTVTTQYDFSGKVLRMLVNHADQNAPAQYHKVATKLNYDAGARLTSIRKNIDSAASDQLIDSMQYNELGQLQNKYLGNNLDSLAYAYNIRGWLTSVNKNYLTSTSMTPLNYFGMELGYDKTTAAAAGTTYKGLQYNGNIAGTIWRSAGDGVNRQYDFSYDSLNRLTGADFNQQLSSSSWGKTAPSNSAVSVDFSTSNLSYDANGNIQTMNQQGFKLGGSVTIDALTYGYLANSNKLNQVSDAANDSASTLGDFHYKGTKGSSDYVYDGNGNLTVDKNKGISYISYTYDGLVSSVSFGSKGLIQYTYDANGNKLRKITWDSLARHTTITYWFGGFVYQHGDTITNTGPAKPDTLQYIAHEEGRARWAFHKYTTGTTAYGWEYDFVEKDHLGNTRVLLSQQKDTATYTATMEGATRATENALFYNIPATAWARSSAPGYPVDTSVTKINDSVARVNGSGQKQGPAIILKVMSGDRVAIKTSYYYNNAVVSSDSTIKVADILNSLASGIVSLTGGAHGSLAQLTGSGNPLSSALSSFIGPNNPIPSGKPNAYLNYILLDNQFNYVSASSGAMPVGPAGTTAGGTLQNPLINPGIPITKSGYLYIYVSNATKGWDVFFDNLSVTVVNGPMLEENHYYPFGLTMAGISDKALKTQYAENKYRFNGKELQSKEFADGTGLEEYDYGARFYDPQIGRWGTIDPHSPNYDMFSPYIYVGNNPLLLIDPDGKDWFYQSVDGKADPTWNWHEGHEYKTGVKDEDGNEVILQGAEAVVEFDGSRGEKLDKKGRFNTNKDDVEAAEVTVYGPNGADDVHHFSGYTMSSNPEKYGVIADGIYDGNYDENGKSGNLKSNWAINHRGPVPDIRGEDPLTGEEYLTGVFIHASNKDGFAGEYSKNGKKGAITKGCLLINPDQWKDFNSVMKGVQNFKVQVDRNKLSIKIMEGKASENNVQKAYIQYITGN